MDNLTKLQRDWKLYTITLRFFFVFFIQHLLFQHALHLVALGNQVCNFFIYLFFFVAGYDVNDHSHTVIYHLIYQNDLYIYNVYAIYTTIQMIFEKRTLLFSKNALD